MLNSRLEHFPLMHRKTFFSISRFIGFLHKGSGHKLIRKIPHIAKESDNKHRRCEIFWAEMQYRASAGVYGSRSRNAASLRQIDANIK